MLTESTTLNSNTTTNSISNSKTKSTKLNERFPISYADFACAASLWGLDLAGPLTE